MNNKYINTLEVTNKDTASQYRLLTRKQVAARLGVHPSYFIYQMTDRISEERRSWNMSRIRGRDTKPEIAVRSLIHRMGYRFTVNGPKNKKLPGKPDIVLPKYNLAVFVHGCFWHRHPKCKYAYTPKSRIKFWKTKFETNVERDREVARLLKAEGWRKLIIWECELRQQYRLKKRLENYLNKVIA